MAPETVFSSDAINIIWTPPLNGGSEITSYAVYVKGSDGNFYTELGYCDGSNPSFVKYANCWIPTRTLRDAPFNLQWGDKVIAKLTARNAYGVSGVSQEGGDAIMVSVPDAPENLIEDTSKRSKGTLGLQWTDGASNGGLEIIDYWISHKENDQSPWTDISTGITSQKYTVFGLTPGKYYLFRVRARNVQGFSESSSTLQLLAASAPEPPKFISTSNVNDQILITWVAPEDNGSVIQGYKIAI
jgi:hypothetical protein